jgi:GT2 family glycosyltransferase
MISQSDFHLSEPLILPIGQDVLLVAWDEVNAVSGPLEIRVDGTRFAGRRASLRLGDDAPRTRMVLAFQTSARSRSTIYLARNGVDIAQITLPHQGLETAAALVEGLDNIARSRLLGFVLGVCRSALRLSSDVVFKGFCRTLIRSALSTEALAFRPRARLTGITALYVAPTSPAIGTVETVYLMDERGITENRFRPAVARVGQESRLLLVAPLAASNEIVAAVLIGHDGAALAAIPASLDPPGIMELAGDMALRGPERRYVLRCLGQLADDADAVAIARALQIFAPERAHDLADPKKPVAAALEFTASCGRAGVFLCGWIRDPHRLVRDAELVSPFGETRLSPCWRRLARPDLSKTWNESTVRDAQPGFIALAPLVEPLSVLQHGLRLRTAGGSLQIMPPARAPSDAEARDMVLHSVPEQDLTDDLLTAIIAPAAAELHSRVMATQAVPEIVEIGAPVAQPAVSFIIPLYRNLSFLRLQIGAFAIDPEIRRDVELIFVLDSPEQRREVEHLLRGLNILTGLFFRLVVMSGNFGYAAANNTGARTARGKLLMLLNSDVIPISPGWLATLRQALETQEGPCPTGVVGPKLLFDDGSLQHAGLTFARDPEGRWYNTHLFKGYPRDWPAAGLPRSVPGVTGAAMLLPRELYDAVGGFTEDYIVGDYEDSDLCLKIRAAGRDIRYEPRAALHHFERRSIELHPGYTGTAASAYNRRLHADRWSDAMAALVAEFERGLAGSERSTSAPSMVLVGR